MFGARSTALGLSRRGCSRWTPRHSSAAPAGAAPLAGDVERQGQRRSPTGIRHRDPEPGWRSLILNGHIDVVSPGPRGHVGLADPFVARHDGDWLYGRGAGDMKAGLAAIRRRDRRAARARSGSRAPDPAAVGGRGGVHRQRRGAGADRRPSAADAVIVTEPTSLTIQRSQVGVLWFQVVVPRAAPAHAGDAPIGHNAIEAGCTVISALRALEAELNASPPPPYDVYEHPLNLNIGIIQGGDWASTVAAEAVLHCRLGIVPGRAGGGAPSASRGDRRRGGRFVGRLRGVGALRRFRVRGLHT